MLIAFATDLSLLSRFAIAKRRICYTQCAAAPLDAELQRLRAS